MPYFHDPTTPAVYAMPEQPQVRPITGAGRAKSRHLGWNVRAEYRVTRADNWLVSTTQWHYPCWETPHSTYHGDYTAEDAARCFTSMHLSPENGWVQIEKDEYDRLQAEYDQRARQNRAPH